VKLVQVLSSGATLVALSALATLTPACGDPPTAPSNYASYTQTDLRAGTGAEAAAGDTLKVHYAGWLYNASQPEQKGAQFASSAGQDPFAFTLGLGEVIQGWDQGVPGMKVGGLRRLVIPSSLAYGANRNGPIPPNSTLVFEIELVEIVAIEDSDGQ